MIKKQKHSTFPLFILLVTISSSLMAENSKLPPATTNTQNCKLDILLTNDDGWQAPGIKQLYKSLQASGHRVTMVAPLTQQSGRSSAINTDVGKSVSIEKQADNVWSVDGSPADSVKAALGIILADQLPSVVISGANFGPNVGQQTVLHSGTLGASLTAHHAGVPAIAISVGIDLKERNSTPAFKSTLEGFETSAKLLNNILKELISQNGCDSPLSDAQILSINVPVPVRKIQGMRYAPLSPNELFHLDWRSENAINKITFTQTNNSVASQNDDVGYFLRKYITVTPISGDLTSRHLNRHEARNSSTAISVLPDLSNIKID